MDNFEEIGLDFEILGIDDYDDYETDGCKLMVSCKSFFVHVL